MAISVLLGIIGGCHVQQVQQVVATPIVAQQVAYVPAVVAPLYQTYGVVDPYWTARDTSAQRIERLLDAVEKQQATIQALTAGKVSQPCSDNPPTPGDAITGQAQAILSKSCMSCHSGETAKKGLDLTKPLSVGEKLLVAQLVSEGSMPPKPAEMLPDDEAAILNSWAHQDKGAVRSLLRGK